MEIQAEKMRVEELKPFAHRFRAVGAPNTHGNSSMNPYFMIASLSAVLVAGHAEAAPGKAQAPNPHVANILDSLAPGAGVKPLVQNLGLGPPATPVGRPPDRPPGVPPGPPPGGPPGKPPDRPPVSPF